MNRFLSSLAPRTHRMTNMSFVRWNSIDRFSGVAKLVEEKKLHYLTIPELMDDKVCFMKGSYDEVPCNVTSGARRTRLLRNGC